MRAGQAVADDAKHLGVTLAERPKFRKNFEILEPIMKIKRLLLAVLIVALTSGNALLELPNVILTPHVAGVTRNAVIQVSTITATNVVDRMLGRPLARANLVNPDVLEKLRV